MEWRPFADVPEEDIRHVLSIARRRTFERNEVVFHRGDPADTLHLIAKGRFAVRIGTPRGDTATIAVKGLGDAFGELALLADERVRSATVSALEPGETFSVHETEFARLRRRHPSVNAVLTALLAEEVRRTTALLLDALYVPADTRVLRRLRELVDVYGEASATSGIPLTQEDIGDLAGTSRATVNRVLRDGVRRRVLELHRGKIVVLDAGALSRSGSRYE